MPTANDHLRVDRLYRNTNDWKKEKDEFNRFFRFQDGKGITNTPGFRPKSSRAADSTDILKCVFCVLVTNLGEIEWPDSLDLETGIFTYYGDNRKPGTAISDTQVGGNRLLEAVFERLHAQKRNEVPPFLCFEVVRTTDGSFMKFLGVACPGAQNVSALDDLVGVWRVRAKHRFQNYRATFTILKDELIKRAWLQDLVDGVRPIESAHCPTGWRHWVKTGIYQALECRRNAQPRSKSEQLPADGEETRVLNQLYTQLTDREFEFASAEIARLLDPRFTDLVVTQAVRDGGRDVVGSYVVGHSGHQVRLSAYIEAKRWNPRSAIGVKPMMRLISRLKHRDIGVFVTTSFFDKQVQAELIADNHPVMLVSGGDVAKLLLARELGTPDTLQEWVAFIRNRCTGNAG